MEVPFPPRYQNLTTEAMSKDQCVFVGLVVSGRLDAALLKTAAETLIGQWATLGGTINTKTTPYTIQTGTKCDFKVRRHPESDLASFLPIDIQFHTRNSGSAPSAPRISKEDVGTQAALKAFHFDSLGSILPTAPPATNFAWRVTVLKDATLLGFRAAHHLVDARSMFDVVKAHSQIVAGEAIPRLIPPPDWKVPLSAITKDEVDAPSAVPGPPSNVTICQPDDVHGVGAWSWLRRCLPIAARIVGKGWISSTDFQTRYIHIPKDVVASWQAKCQSELKESGVHDVRLSKLDVITSWALRAAYRKMKPTGGPFDVLYIVENRFCVKPPAAGFNYLRNSQYPTAIRWRTQRDFASASHAATAHAFRSAVTQGKSLGFMKRFHHFYERNVRRPIAPGPDGSQAATSSLITSWCSFSYHDLDFAAAAVDASSSSTEILAEKAEGGDCNGGGGGGGGGGGHKLQPGGILFVDPAVIALQSVFVGMVISLDREGNYNMKVNALRSAWEALEIELGR